MKIVRSIADLELSGEIGLVPTMGALHDGHRSLLRAARSENEVVVASLFVNPAQFGEAADLAAYPRDEAEDTRIAEECGVDVLFAPRVEEMYPPGFGTWVETLTVTEGAPPFILFLIRRPTSRARPPTRGISRTSLSSSVGSPIMK